MTKYVCGVTDDGKPDQICGDLASTAYIVQVFAGSNGGLMRGEDPTKAALLICDLHRDALFPPAPQPADGQTGDQAGHDVTSTPPP